MLKIPDDWKKDLVAWRAEGCSSCNDSGVSGRTGIYEVMPISKRIQKHILESASDQVIREAAIEEGMYTLQMAAVDKMRKGIISLDEVFGVTM